MARKNRKGRSGPRSINLAQTLAGLASGAILLRPYMEPGRTVDFIKKGEYTSVPNAFVNDTKKALTFGNVIAAAAPPVVVGAARYGMRAVGVRTPKIGKRVRVL